MLYDSIEDICHTVMPQVTMKDALASLMNMNNKLSEFREHPRLRELMKQVGYTSRLCYSITRPFKVTNEEFLCLHVSFDLFEETNNWHLRVCEMYTDPDTHKVHDSDRFMDVKTDDKSLHAAITDILKDAYDASNNKTDYMFPMFNKNLDKTKFPSYCLLYEDEE